MTYTKEDYIKAMAEAMRRVHFHDEGETVYQAYAKAPLAASPVHAELERVKAENERLCAVIDAATTRRAMQHDEDYVKIGYDDWVNLRQALQQKGGEL